MVFKLARATVLAIGLCSTTSLSALCQSSGSSSDGNSEESQPSQSGRANWQSLSPEERRARLQKFIQNRQNGGGGQGLQNRQGRNASADRNSPAPTSSGNYIFHGDCAYGSERQQDLDVYQPKTDAAGQPIIFYLHGGGWMHGDKASGEMASKAEAYTQNGVVFVSANYRLAPSVMHPKQIEDVAAAFAWVKSHAKEFGGDPNHIVIMGHSAGAHLVDLLGTNERYLAEKGLSLKDISAVVSLDTASLDLTTRKTDGSPESQMVGGMIEKAFGDNPKVLADGSPTLNIQTGKKYPPFLMYCGLSRAVCMAQHRQFADNMKKVGGSVSVRPVPLSHKDINIESGKTDSDMFKAILGLVKG